MFYLILFIFLSCWGSFITCCAWRLTHHYSLCIPYSFCDHCLTPLKPWQLIPLFGFIVQNGHCYFCKHVLPRTSFILEILLPLYGISLISQNYYSTFSLLQIFIILSWLLFLALQDYYTQTVSSFCLFSGYTFLLFPILNRTLTITNLIGTLSISLFLTLFVLLNMLGMGDLLLVNILSLLFNWYFVVYLIFLASCLAIIFRLIPNISTKKTFPFIPYLTLSCALLIFINTFYPLISM